MKTEKWYGLMFISPMVVGYCVFLLGPMLMAFAMSFTDWSLIRELSFVGFDNYRKAFTADPVFMTTVKNTLLYSIGFVPPAILIPLGLALILKGKFFGVGFFRTAVFTPYVIPIVVWAILWKYILQTDNGLINSLLNTLGIQGPAWLYNLSLALPTLIVVSLLKGLGMNMIIFITALNDVPKTYYEAAKIDGVSKWKNFIHVTLPLISPSIFLVSILTLIGSLKVFALVYVMTDGGPGTSTYVFVYYIYQLAFKIYEFGYASAIAFILFVIILSLTLVQWSVRKRWVHYEQ
ncbi:carbohydrate ABC transporter permease [Cohnella faecalis]|uniref:Sugar ABC transporter permease n=1 Tax=Cohnella faecalis TaxID=2315694 RepID=A0A398CV72_9BACL|nr:sugar ABC transporter permease [Cohnella faecalis]RIE03161.1 sugar ABC transporter permease [Cohnella faecalis]